MSVSNGQIANEATFNAAFVSKTADSTVASTITQDKEMILKHQSAPTTPAAEYSKLYVKSDDKVYTKNSSGDEKLVGANTLSELDDVDVTGASDGEVLTRVGGQWVGAAASGGGGGGGALLPYAFDDSPAPISQVFQGLDVLSFSKAAGQFIVYNYKVPQGYVPGLQIDMSFMFLSEDDTTDEIEWKARATLYKIGDAISSPSGQHVSTTAAIELDTALELLDITLDLTDGSGEINSVAVAPGDLIRIEVFRDAGDESDFDGHLIKATVEVQ
jgi:hypothetical protein